MNRADDATAREEGSENRQPKSEEDQPHVPHLQHAALFLHHDRVQKRRARQPGHQGSILHRIPSPVAAPPEDGISPMGTEEDSASKKSPGDHGPAAGNVNPFFAGILHDQRAESEGERNRETYVSEIE